MKSISPRKQKTIDGVIALRNLLLDIAAYPSNYSENSDLISCLKDQKRTASLKIDFFYENKPCQTLSMTLNTLKKHSNEAIDGGFELLDSLRVGAIDAINSHIEKENSPNKRTKLGLEKMVTLLEAQLQDQRRINLVLLQGLSEAIHSIKNIQQASQPELKEKMCEDSIKKLRAIVSLNAPPYDNLERSKIVNVNPLRDR